ncbi:MAG: AraC family transcriptional regulator ligand-binding domain-containing protein [Sphingomonadales bacterium]|nr:AraC family transcriptional regulator ligand-binding domain-containing protein [Sphingomonadales bacterium]
MAQFIDPKSGEVLSLPLQSETSGLNFGDAKMTHISYKKEFSDIRQVTSLRLLVDFAREHDIPALEILKGTELDLDDIEDPYCEIQVWQELRAIQNLLEIDDDPANGVILGMRQHLTCYGTLGFAMMASRTLEQALTIGAKFYKISLWINEVSVVEILTPSNS